MEGDMIPSRPSTTSTTTASSSSSSSYGTVGYTKNEVTVLLQYVQVGVISVSVKNLKIL